MERTNPKTSMLSYEKIMKPGAREGTYYKIILALEWINEGTAWEIAAQARIKPDKVWKRLSELRRDGVIFDTQKTRLSPDGNSAMVYAMSNRKDEYNLPPPERHYMEGQTTAADYATNLIAKTKQGRVRQQELFDSPS